MKTLKEISEERLIQGTPKNEYDTIHAWLRYHFGAASKCENSKCLKVSNNFAWAKKRGFSYAKDRKVFWQLCYSCHARYDITEESRKRMRESHIGHFATPETKVKLSKIRKGHPVSLETRLKLRQKHLGKTLSIETRKAISLGKKGKPVFTKRKIIKQLDLNGKFIKEFRGVTIAAKILKIQRTSISSALTGLFKTAGGYRWQYA